MSHAIPARPVRLGLRLRLHRWVHRAVVAELVSPVQSSVSDVDADGWLCLRCGVRVPKGGDRTPHFGSH